MTLTRQPIDPINLTWQDHGFVHARGGRLSARSRPRESHSDLLLRRPTQLGHGGGVLGQAGGRGPDGALQPCGQAKARFVGPDGKPLAKLNAWPYFQLLMTPGSTHGFFADRGEQLQADAAYLPNVDPKHYGKDFVTDAEGRVDHARPDPRHQYRISDWSTRNDVEKGVQLRKDFTVKPGETLDLGDIRVEHPES